MNHQTLEKVFAESIGCIIIENFSNGEELELQEIALQKCRIGIAILFVFFKRQELVLVFYC